MPHLRRGIALAFIFAGIYLTLRPFTSLDVTLIVLATGFGFALSGVDGAMRERAEENIPTHLPSVPVLLLQGTQDSAIPLTSQHHYVGKRCEGGWELDYRTYNGLDHISLVEPGSESVTDAISWTSSVFDGATPPREGCR